MIRERELRGGTRKPAINRTRPQKVCYGHRKFAAATESLLRPQKVCCGHRKFAAATESLLRPQKVCYGRRKFAAATESLLRPQKVCWSQNDRKSGRVTNLWHR